MIHLNLDSEQAMMILIAADASNAILKARLHRVDPENVISNSAILQDHKITQLKAQIAEGQLARWDDLSIVEKGVFLDKIRVLAADEDPKLRAAAYDWLTEFVLSHRSKKSYIGERPTLPKP